MSTHPKFVDKNTTCTSLQNREYCAGQLQILKFFNSKKIQKLKNFKIFLILKKIQKLKNFKIFLIPKNSEIKKF
jgi:hypothetical protein